MFKEKFVKTAGPIGWLRAAVPWIRDAIAARRTAPILGLSEKILERGSVRTFKNMPWTGAARAGEATVPLKERPLRMLQAWTGSALNPLYTLEKNVEIAWKRPDLLGELLNRQKNQFLHKVVNLPKPSIQRANSLTQGTTGEFLERFKTTGATLRSLGFKMKDPPLSERFRRAWIDSSPPKGIFAGKSPVKKGGNLFRRTPLGMVAHGALGTGIGIGITDALATPGTAKEKAKQGIKDSILWGPARTLTMTKAVGYDMPKALFKNLKKKPASELSQPMSLENSDIIY